MVSNDWIVAHVPPENLLEIHLRTVINPTWNYNKRCRDEQDEVMNAGLGLAGEAGEIVDILKKQFFHKVKNRREEMLLELGDLMYYYTKLIDLYGFTIEEILEANKVKLFERYEINEVA